jgi:hypothetical protein
VFLPLIALAPLSGQRIDFTQAETVIIDQRVRMAVPGGGKGNPARLEALRAARRD